MSNLWYFEGAKHLYNDKQLALARVDNPDLKAYPVEIAPQPEHDAERETVVSVFPPKKDGDKYIAGWRLDPTFEKLQNAKLMEIQIFEEESYKADIILNLGVDTGEEDIRRIKVNEIEQASLNPAYTSLEIDSVKHALTGRITATIDWAQKRREALLKCETITELLQFDTGLGL